MFENGTIVADAFRLHLIQRALVRATSNLSPEPRDATYFHDASVFIREIVARNGAHDTHSPERTTRTWAPHDASSDMHVADLKRTAVEGAYDTEKLAATAEAMSLWLRVGQNRPSVDDLRLLRQFVGQQMEAITSRERSRLESRQRAEQRTDWSFFGQFA